MTQITFTVMDYDGEKSTISYRTIPLATDGSNLTTVLTGMTTMRTYIEGIMRGVVVQTQMSKITRITNAPASDPEAAREEKWVVTYEDTTEFLDAPANTIPNPGYGKVFNVEIPCADLSQRIDNSEIVYTPAMASPPAAVGTFVSGFEGVVRSPYSGSVQVLEIRSVGRNT